MEQKANVIYSVSEGYLAIIGWGDTKKDCVNYLKNNPQLKADGYEIILLGNAWVVAKRNGGRLIK